MHACLKQKGSNSYSAFDVALVIGNDGCWGMIKHNMAKYYANRDIVGCDLPITHYEKIIEAIGGYGERVEKPADIAPAMERAFSSGSRLHQCICRSDHRHLNRNKLGTRMVFRRIFQGKKHTMYAFSQNNRKLICLMLLFLFSLAAKHLYAAETGPQSISWKFMFIGLAGGLALFLYGMNKMSAGMKHTAGNQMRSILASLTKNRVIALSVGAFVTMVIQSSSATTVMLVSFVQSGLMTFVQSLGVILGADIGTTITAQLIAFKLTDYALLMVAVGFALPMVSKTDNAKNIGEVILGFGILFFGMKLMSDAMEPLRTHPGFMEMMKGLENPFAGLVVGTIFTAIVQSSSASTGVVIVLAQQNLISLEAGIAVIFGANIGTCVTAGLACIGASREAKRVALSHVLFKIAGVLLFIFWIPQFAELIQTISEQFGSQTARQIANAHTLFNVSMALCFLPFTNVFGTLILKILPDKKIDIGIIPATWHLDEGMIETPAIAIDLARTEISRVAKLLGRMMRAIIIPFMSDEKLIKPGRPDKRGKGTAHQRDTDPG